MNIASIMFLLACIAGGISSPQLGQNGLKGYEWGSDFAAMKDTFALEIERDLDLERLSPRLKSYRSNIHSFGNADVDCIFSFYDNKLFSIGIATQYLYNYNKLKDYIVTVFGKPYDTVQKQVENTQPSCTTAVETQYEDFINNSTYCDLQKSSNSDVVMLYICSRRMMDRLTVEKSPPAVSSDTTRPVPASAP